MNASADTVHVQGKNVHDGSETIVAVRKESSSGSKKLDFLAQASN